MYPGRPSKNHGIYNPEAEEAKAVLDRARLLLRILRLPLLLCFFSVFLGLFYMDLGFRETRHLIW
jgi:hypothetical protein